MSRPSAQWIAVATMWVLIGALMAVAASAVMCCTTPAILTDVSAKDYPCGVHGVSCDKDHCCDEDAVCGGEPFTGCPANTCCWVGPSYSYEGARDGGPRTVVLPYHYPQKEIRR